MKRTRKKRSAAFKAKVAVAAIRDDRTVFEGGAAAEGASNEAQVDLLYRRIGQLKIWSTGPILSVLGRCRRRSVSRSILPDGPAARPDRF